jgi:hypothetical protein
VGDRRDDVSEVDPYRCPLKRQEWKAFAREDRWESRHPAWLATAPVWRRAGTFPVGGFPVEVEVELHERNGGRFWSD